MSPEDEMVNELIKQHKKYIGSLYSKVDATPEAHYNHYGSRGVADLLVVEQDQTSPARYAHLYEVKGEAAIEEATGANEILRQFNKMRKYFFEDESNPVRYTTDIELCFVATEKTVRHVMENYEMYISAHRENLFEGHRNTITNPERVVFRSVSDCHALPLSLRGEETAEEWAANASEVRGPEAANVVSAVIGDGGSQSELDV